MDFTDPALTAPIGAFTPTGQLPPGVDPNVPVGLPPLGIPVSQIPQTAPAALPPAAAPLRFRAPEQTITAGPPRALPPSPQPGPGSTLPGSGGVSPPPVGAAPLPGSPINDAAGNLQEAGQGQVDALQAQDAQQQAELLAQAEQQDAAARAEEHLLEQQAEARRHADQIVEERRKTFDAAKYHDFWSDKGVGRQIAVGLGVFLGAFGPGDTNHAAQIVENAINRDFQRQSKEHESFLRGVELAQAAGRELSSRQLHELGAFRHIQAAKLEAVVKHGEAMAAHSKNQFGVAQLRTKLSEMQLEAAKLQEESTRATQAAVERKRMDDSTIALHKSQAVENYAQAAKARAGATGEKELAGETFIAKMGKRLFPQQENAIKAVKLANEGEEIIKALRENPSSLQGALTKERLVSLFANGGRPSVVALQMVKKGAGSWADVAESDLMSALTGKDGKAIRQNMIKVAETKVAEEHRAVEEYKVKHDSALRGVAKRYPDQVANHKLGIFGEERQGPPAGARPVRGPGGQQGFLYPDGTVHLPDGSVAR